MATTMSGSPVVPSIPSLGDGEMAQRIRAMDWSATPLGPIDRWSPTLRTMVRLMLANRFPLLLWWGPEFVQLYNDAYARCRGPSTRGPWGRPARECWPEIWHIIGPLIETPFNGGPATWMDDILLEINRHGFVEETHFTIAYSPVPDEAAPRGIGGVLATVHETTEQVVRSGGCGAARPRRPLRRGEDRGGGVRASPPRPEPPRQGRAVRADLPARGRRRRRPASREPRASSAARQSAPLDGRSSQGMAARLAARRGLAAASGGGRGGSRHPPLDTSRRARGRTRRATALVAAHPVERATTASPASWSPASARASRLDEAYVGFLELVAAQVGDGDRQRARLRGGAAARRGAGRARPRQDRLLLQRQPRVPHAAHADARAAARTLLAGAPDACRRTRASSSTVAHRNALRLLKLVNTLLDFSRIEAGRVEASYEPIDLAALTAELAERLPLGHRARRAARCVVDCPPLAEPVYVDRDMWEKIVLNLLSNAFKFTFEGEIAVALRAGGRRASSSRCATPASASRPSELPHLFERFHRVRRRARAHARGHRHRARAGAGAGPAARRRASRSRARWARGTTFTVAIPLGHGAPAGRAHRRRGTLASHRPGAAAPYVEEALRWLPERRGAGDGRRATRAPVGPRLGATRSPQRPAPASSSPTTTPTCATTCARLLGAALRASRRSPTARRRSTRAPASAAGPGAAPT